MRKFIPGVKVKIITSTHTDETFSIGPSMKRMVGRIFEVESCGDESICSHKGYCVSLDGWCWDPDDVEETEDSKPLVQPNSQLFDVDLLDIG